MRLHIVNPNTTAAMTANIAAAAHAVALPNTPIDARQPAMGPVSIEGFYDEALAVPACSVASAMRWRGRPHHRLFRRHRSRCGACDRKGTGRRHRRGRLRHGEPDCGAFLGDDDALRLNRADRA
jgi:hypothetical protein